MRSIAFLFAIGFLISQANGYFQFTEQLKRDFESNFHERCDKYPFVQRWVNRLEDPKEAHHLIYVFQENGLRNGGLGDKLTGLIEAVILALRFDRILLIRQSVGLEELFTPYHPSSIRSKEPKYSYKRSTWENWSKYDEKYCCDDAHEYDVYQCINNIGTWSNFCGIVGGDPPQEHILYRGNRCYLCNYRHQPLSNAYEELLGVLGVPVDADLYEVAGCALRLALWPTEKFWDDVGEIYQNFDYTVPRKPSNHHHQHFAKEKGFHSADGGKKKYLRNRRHLDEQEPSRMPWKSVHHNAPYYQISMHYRCGDTSYLHAGESADHYCTYHEDEKDEKYLKNLEFGNPVAIAECADRVLKNKSISLQNSFDDHESVGVRMRALKEVANLPSLNDDITVTKAKNIDVSVLEGKQSSVETMISSNITNSESQGHPAMLLLNTMVIIFSDNEAAANQIKDQISHPYTFLTPNGCHVEIEATPECFKFTFSYWFMMSLSNVIVGQKSMQSGFSRLAGIYGLQQNPFRTQFRCDDYETTEELGMKQVANWFC